MGLVTLTAESEKLSGVRGLRYAVKLDKRPATFAEVIHGWMRYAVFRTRFNALLADAPYTAFRWEVPAVTSKTISQPFEFVLLDSPELDRDSDPEAFAEQFARAESEVTIFRNLGNDAVLVVPCPVVRHSAYGHLASFVRQTPRQQWQSLWQSVGVAMAGRIGVKPVWLSTAGAGVSWLHVRLDDRPKYYGFEPYKSSPT